MQTTDRNAWLRGATTCCNVPPPHVASPARLVLLGAPGVGKGTQAELLSRHLGACHLSTGDIFRASKNACHGEPTPAMKTALDCMQRGELVSDEVVLEIVAERSKCLRCGGGFLLDGFPRTLAQAEALDKLFESQNIRLDAVLNYELPLNTIVARLSGRRTCHKCRAVFHVDARPPVHPGLCDHCGSPLYQREDDRPESIRVRMDAYHHSTVPLTNFYHAKGLLISIVADGSPEQVFRRTIDALFGATHTSPLSATLRKS